MKMNLFLIFEPFTFFFTFLNSLIINMMVVTLISFILQKKNPKGTNTWGNPSEEAMISKLNSPSYSWKNKFVMCVILSLLLFFNIIGLFPWVLCITSHISVNLALGGSAWLAMFMMQMHSTTASRVVHMTPKGSPLGLSFFLAVVELVSKLIQPFTLSLRLTANMIAGHLILSFISGVLCDYGFSWFFGVLTGLSLVSLLEFAVSLIQAYVYTALLVLYFSE